MNDFLSNALLRSAACILATGLTYVWLTGSVYAQRSTDTATGKFVPGAVSAMTSGHPATTTRETHVKQNLGYLVNSRFDDLNPVVTTDGKTIFFARKYSLENTGGRSDPQDIWMTTQVGGRWTASRNLGPPVNTSKADNLCAISADEKTLYFFIQTGKQKGYFGFRERLPSGWSAMQSTGLVIENESPFLEASLALNGSAILFTARNRLNLFYNSEADERDIFVSLKKPDGSWSGPVNIGPVVNSRGDEYSPFLAADGKTLYFASNGRTARGDADIFLSRRTGPGWTDWSEPINLGPEINTPGFDGYLTVPASGDVAYLATSRQSLGKADLVQVTLPPTMRPEPVTSILGVIRDARTGQNLNARVSLVSHDSDHGTNAESDISGRYSFHVTPAKKWIVEAEVAGYFKQKHTVFVSDEVATEVNFFMHRCNAGTRIETRTVYFEEGKADLLPSSFGALDTLVSIMRANPGLTIRVDGHTDNRGTRSGLYELSRKRVKAVRAHLVQTGIHPKRISVRAFGPSSPAAANSTEETRSLNRRVEFIVIRP